MILCGDPRAGFRARRKRILAAAASVLEGGSYILGAECAKFEAEFARYSGARYGVGLANATDAIHLSLRALGIGAGDEVIVPSHTASATVAAVLMSGAVPVFADVDEDTFCIDPGSAAARVTRRTRAIVAVHLYGQPADLPALAALAKKKNLSLVEDCSQAHGALYGRRRVGAWGAAACFSFYPTKNLAAMGDGGMAVTSDAGVCDRLLSLRQYGWDSKRISREPGWNSRLDELQAAFLRIGLKGLDEDNRRRRDNADFYVRGLAGLPVVLPALVAGTTHVYHQFVVRVRERDALRAHLERRGVQALVHYPVPTHLQPAYARCRGRRDLPKTEKIVREILSLPVHPGLSAADRGLVASAVREFYRG